MTIRNVEIEWFDEKFECNCAETHLTVLFWDFALPNEEEKISRIIFSLDKFAQKYQYVMLGFNREINVMAIKPVEYRIPGAYKIYLLSQILWEGAGIYPAETDVVLTTPEQFIKEFGLEHSDTAVSYEAEFDEEKQILLVAIDKDKLVKASASE